MKSIKLLCVLLLLLTGCAAPKATPPAVTPSAIPATDTATAPAPTDTPLPAETSTPEPTPLDFSGMGDTSLDVSAWPQQPGVIFYEGQSNKGYFALVPYDENNQPMSAICNVNSFDPYKGACLFNADGKYAIRLDTKTTGKWTLKISPLSQARTLSVPGTITGNGNDLIVLTGGVPNLATISANAEKQLFVLIPYKADGSRMISLVNTSDPYQDTVSIRSGTAIIEVMATGSWTITITGK